MTAAPGGGALRSRWTVADGFPIHARVALGDAPAGRVPVVLVHGQVVSGRYMVPLALHLRTGFPVLVPDLPGYGRSAKPPWTLGLPELADVLAAWMRQNRLARAALVGNSFGCQIIAELAVRHPECVGCAVLQGPTIDGHARSRGRQTLRWVRNMPREDPRMGPIMIRDYLDAGFARSLRTFAMALGDRIEDRLPRMTMPTLVVRGGRDPIVSQAWAEKVTTLLPRGRLIVIPGGPHTLNFTMPLELARVLRPFLGGRGPARERGRGATACARHPPGTSPTSTPPR